MTLADIFTQLAYGELSQLAIGQDPDNPGQILESRYAEVAAHVSLGLTALYKRFLLKEGRTTVPLVAGTTSYTLAAADLLKVEQVLTDAGEPFGLNDAADAYAIATPQAHVLRVPAAVANQEADLPESLQTTALEVVYRANHAALVLPAGAFNPASVTLELPVTHLEPLLYYVASRVQTPVGMANEGNLAQLYFAKYEQACQQIEQAGLQLDRDTTSMRAERGGWV